MIRAGIIEAINDEAVIGFYYERPSGGRATHYFLRTVSPWVADQENFLGWDHGRDEIRRFSYEKIKPTTMYTDEPLLALPDEEYVQPTE